MAGNPNQEGLPDGEEIVIDISNVRRGSRITRATVSFNQKTSEEHVFEIERQVSKDLLYAEDQPIPGEPVKLLVALLFLGLGLSASTFSLAMVHDRMTDYSPLPDIFLDTLPSQPWSLDASEYIIVVSTWAAGLVVLFHKHRTIVARRVCLLVGLHHFYRAVTLFVTVLPSRNKNFYCDAKSNNITMLAILKWFVKLASGFGLALDGNSMYCGDYIYSGHTVILILSYLIIQEYSPRSWFLLHYTFFLTTALGIFFLLLNRGHYSIDCIIAYWITTRVWWMFHTLANNKAMKEAEYGNARATNNNYLRRAWWWYMFRYFERNVPANLPLTHSWPLPQKLNCLNAFQRLTRRLASDNNYGSLGKRSKLSPLRTDTEDSIIHTTSSWLK